MSELTLAVSEVQSVLEALYVTKATGSDKIPAKLLKEAASVIAPLKYLSNLFKMRNNVKNLKGVNKLQVPKPNTSRFGLKSVRYLAAVTWNNILTAYDP